MTRLLIRKFMLESRLLLAACTTLISVFFVARIWVLCQFDLQKFKPLVDQLDAFKQFLPFPIEQVLTYPGSLAVSFNDPVVILSVLVWAVARGTDVVAGELGRGTLEMLLTQPVSRVRLVVVHWIMSTLGLAIICFAAWVAIYVGVNSNSVTETVTTSATVRLPLIPLDIPISLGATQEVVVPLSDKVEPYDFIQPCLSLFGFGFIVLCASVLFSCLERFRWRAIGATLSLYIVQLLIFMLSRISERTKWLENFSILAYYQPDWIAWRSGREGVSWSLSVETTSAWPNTLSPVVMTCVLLVVGCGLVAAGVTIFKRRDLPAPL